MVPLDIMGKLNNFKESFNLDKYYETRKQLFADLIDFSKRPEATSARDCVKQFTALAEEEQTEAAELFKEALESQDG